MFRRLPCLAAMAVCLICGLLSPGSARALEITSAMVAPSPFSPNGDGNHDTTFVIFNLSDTADVVAVDISGSPRLPENSRTLSLPGPVAPGHYEVPWDGRSSLGAAVAAGTYVVNVQARRGVAVTQVLGLGVVVDLVGPKIEQVIITPNPFVPLQGEAGTPKPDHIDLTIRLTRFSRSPVAGDRVTATVRKIPDRSRDFDEALDLSLDTLFTGDTVVFHGVWAPADTFRDGVHALNVDAFDAAGNHSGGDLWAIDVALRGPTLNYDNLPAATKIGATAIYYTYLRAFPDSIRGTSMDRLTADALHNVDSVWVRYASGPWVLAALDRSAPLVKWTVPFPAPGDANHHQGLLVADFKARNHLGFATTETRTLDIDTIIPAAIVPSYTLPHTVRRGEFIIPGSCVGSDSLYTTLTGPTGAVTQAVKPTDPKTPGAFRDTLELYRGLNTFEIQGGDVAGNRSPAFTGTVDFQFGAGVTAPEVFRAGDAILARLASRAASVEARIYRPDGGFVRRLYTEHADDASTRDSFELPWDLTNENLAKVGRGPYLCVVKVTYSDGTTEMFRLAVVAMP
jgi:hypothetical protein